MELGDMQDVAKGTDVGSLSEPDIEDVKIFGSEGGGEVASRESPAEGTLSERGSSTTCGLASIVENIGEALAALQDSAGICQQIESDDLREVVLHHECDESFKCFLQETYLSEVPEGVAKNRAYNEEYEQETEKEEQDMDFAFLGYTFTFDQKKFWTIAGDMSNDIRRGLVEFGVANPPGEDRDCLSRQEFERFYFQDPREAYSWQELYSDADEDDELTKLLGLLRSLRAA
jgi:hypothetical protein